MSHRSVAGEFRALIGDNENGFGRYKCRCSKCESSMEDGSKYTAIVFRPSGTWVKCKHVPEGNDNRLRSNETKMTKNKNQFEKIEMDKLGNSIFISLTYEEFMREFDKWNDMRKYNGYEILKLDKILGDDFIIEP